MIEPEYIGHLLLQQGFKNFTLYLFKAIEGKKFIVEKPHNLIFDTFQDIYDGKIKRINFSLCPRSGKTTIAKWFTIWTLTNNPKSNIIYTSYSASLLSEISQDIANILEHPIYKAMYPNKTYQTETIDSDPINDFWKDYLLKNENKSRYSAKLIRTYAGGTVLFNAVGSSIIGFGSGTRDNKTFSGYLLMDDINKPIDTRSEVLRKKVLTYYTDTLLSRINHSDTPIINIQQRLHLEDLTGYLQSKYNFETLKVPLLDENNVCNLPSQYTLERIKELKIDNYSFMCQYQQEPIVLGGAIIKREWFNYYDINFKYKYKKIVISADTAMSIKESADRTCLLVGGVTENNNLHILDFVCGRFEYPELKQKIVSLWNKWQLNPRETSATGLYIEEKASGIQAIQELSRCGIPIIPLKADKDKLARVQGVLEYMASGMVYLPQSEIYGFNNEILSELESFTRDNSHLHDDITDALCYLINSTIAKQQVSILDVID